MANIMLTYRCNLSCPYCFANEFVNHADCDISLEGFRRALEFIKTSPERHVGLIGGEPTIHRGFEEILRLLDADEQIASVTIYTNGIQMEECLAYLQKERFSILVNCNSPVDIGQVRYEQLKRNLDRLFDQEGVWKRANLGVNLYRDELDYGYILELLERYHLHRVRMSVTVPNLDESKKQDSLEYLRSRKDYVFRFIMDCADRDIAPYFDCNVIPRCVWTEDELRSIEAIVKKFRLKNTNLTGLHGFCKPVIDILPDLTAVRCFGTSDFSKMPIGDFRSLEDLRSYYVNLIDCHVTNCMKRKACLGCYERDVLRCSAGCLAFIRNELADGMKEYRRNACI